MNIIIKNIPIESEQDSVPTGCHDTNYIVICNPVVGDIKTNTTACIQCIATAAPDNLT